MTTPPPGDPPQVQAARDTLASYDAGDYDAAPAAYTAGKLAESLRIVLAAYDDLKEA